MGWFSLPIPISTGDSFRLKCICLRCFTMRRYIHHCDDTIENCSMDDDDDKLVLQEVIHVTL